LHRHSVANLPRVGGMLGKRATTVGKLTQAQRRVILRVLETLPDADALCHGDYHPDNVLLSARGPLVIDWENAALGDPLADVARTLLLFRTSFLSSQLLARRTSNRVAAALVANLYLWH